MLRKNILFRGILIDFIYPVFMTALLVLIIFLTLVSSVMAEESFALNAESAILMEYETGEILYEKNAQKELPPASMSKIMTMLLAMEAVDSGRADLDDKLVVSELAARMGGSQIWLEPGEEMSLEEMMRAIAIVSANDACVAVAEYLYGTEEAFVKKMNERARELNLNNTYFYNTNGLPPDGPGEQGNYTSVYDLAVMARELLKHPKVLEWTSTWIDYLRNGDSVLNNTNRLIWDYKGADGLKTGFTEEAKFCLTATAVRDGVRFISVVMGVDDSKIRFNESAQLLTFGFSKYKGLMIVDKGQFIDKIQVRNAENEYVDGIAFQKIVVPVKRGEEESITSRIEINKNLSAPFKKGDKIGELKVYRGNLLIKKEDIAAPSDVKKASFFKLIARLVRQIIIATLGIFKL